MITFQNPYLQLSMHKSIIIKHEIFLEYLDLNILNTNFVLKFWGVRQFVFKLWESMPTWFEHRKDHDRLKISHGREILCKEQRMLKHNKFEIIIMVIAMTIGMSTITFADEIDSEENQWRPSFMFIIQFMFMYWCYYRSFITDRNTYTPNISVSASIGKSGSRLYTAIWSG